jgi:hypothetical protein
MKSLKNAVTVMVLPMTLPVHDGQMQHKTLYGAEGMLYFDAVDFFLSR